MKIISHRGNLFGPDSKNENKPEIIESVLGRGIDVEIDLWYVDGSFYLGHDRPDYSIDYNFLFRNGLWIHAKNLGALYKMAETGLHYFWHQNDDFTLTSKNIIWTYPGKEVTDRSVIVTLENNLNNFLKEEIYGICTDYAEIK